MSGFDTNHPMSKNCPQCGSVLSAGALEGLCPVCLLQQGAIHDSAHQGHSAAFEPLSLEEVGKLFPQLEILGLLGKGGMGTVYKARQPELDRFVALKLLPPQPSAEPRFADRFNREARALARLSHPNIVAVHEFGYVQAMPYFIMEFVDGLNLRQLQKNRTLSPREAIQIVPQICDALQYAHDQGVVHRDIKPENVLLDRKGHVKIADFGLAKILDLDPARMRLTADGQVMGTPHYMAPEQVEHPQEVDHRADIFSLGVVFYELLTGELPLGRFAPPSQKFQLDVRLDEVVLRALEKEPQLRYQRVSEIKDGVEAITAMEPASPVLPAPVRTGRNFWKIAIPSVCALALCGIGVHQWFPYRVVAAKQPKSMEMQVLEDQRPVVVRTQPVSGAQEVPPGLFDISVTFSKEMADESWSWSTAWLDSTPEGVEKPSYASDHRTCVMKVRLEPGKTYGYWLNSDQFHHFTDAEGRPAVPYLLIFQTAKDGAR